MVRAHLGAQTILRRMKMFIINKKIESSAYEPLILLTNGNGDSDVAVVLGDDSILIPKKCVEEFIQKLRDIVAETNARKKSEYI